MRIPNHIARLMRAPTRAGSLLTLFVICVSASVVGACGSSDNSPGNTPLSVVKPVVDCSKLASMDITDIGGAGSSITSATVTAAAVNGATVNFCTVKGTLAPSNTFEVALPVSSWTQRFAELGCGGLCGNLSDPTKPTSFSFSYACPLVQEGGFVTAATDMGHAGQSSAWTTDPQKQADFAYRGQHITTLAAKKLIQAYYGQAQKYSYFVGCSDGGREALIAAQRYPADYNGIVAGAPAAHFQIQNSLYHGWSVESNSTTGTSAGNAVLYADKAAVLHKAVIAACGNQSGAPDGLIADPRTCNFDPASIQCAASASSTSTCLTAAEVATASKIYSGPTDATTGVRMLAGSPQYGSEANWVGVEVPTSNSTDAPVPVTGLFSYSIVTGAYNLIFTGSPSMPNIDTFGYRDASFYPSYLQANHPLNDATSPDLSAFKNAGGKLILWHGWADQHISPLFTIAYYQAVQNTMGESSANEFTRLYVVPGVAHCGGGEGFPNIDLVSKITGWVEQGTAPAAVTTYQTDASNNVTASRPVYPYPAVAKYTGSGDWHTAANYAQGAPLYTAAAPVWAGSSFYTSYSPKTQGVAAP
ncbi:MULTISPECIES: tannase/feruloyl esterase family alpha/beta hydrolase [unclassified Caballeronia]|uniref:tannase/feruloyl esterase family alpha/beta hydrolase n=1 Tax=unclassified Caballeronia TaxID=2646786 RepID=UPI0028659D96|nr:MULTISPECIES: tannase/feruloyl esterase family alpha/beta hydrolase [unclassified Caballeronia]MDR5752461.1 tannase/feruloyl esterase family alpha/beta hydrolase [Caballeronia sp. LZ024]MDR5845267.1 tannase/feruloyl esterase family alpha/beta hydrolase [Caballeronia sp. LZ031]